MSSAAIRRMLAANGDRRAVIVDGRAKYFGAKVDENSLTPRRPARIGTIALEDWLHSLPVRA